MQKFLGLFLVFRQILVGQITFAFIVDALHPPAGEFKLQVAGVLALVAKQGGVTDGADAEKDQQNYNGDTEEGPQSALEQQKTTR